MEILFKFVIIILGVYLLAYLLNKIEDYYKNKSLIKLSFAATLEELNLPIVTLMNNGQSFNFLIDTGASVSIIDSRALNALEHTKLSKEGTSYGIDGNIINSSYVEVDLFYKDVKFSEEFQVLRMNAFDNIQETNHISLVGILGSSFLNENKFTVNFEELMLVFNKNIFNNKN